MEYTRPNIIRANDNYELNKIVILHQDVFIAQ